MEAVFRSKMRQSERTRGESACGVAFRRVWRPSRWRRRGRTRAPMTSEQADHLHGGSGGRRLTDVTARLYAEVVARNTGPAGDDPSRRRRCARAAAVQNAPPDGYTLLFLRLPTCHRRSDGDGALRAGQGLCLHHAVVRQRGRAGCAAGQPGEDARGAVRLGAKIGRALHGHPGLARRRICRRSRRARANAPLQSIHYRGGASMMADVLTGGSISACRPCRRRGRSWPTRSCARFALDIAERWPGLPDVADLGGARLRQGEGGELVGVAAPAGTPSAIRAEAARGIHQGVARSRAAETSRRERHADRDQHVGGHAGHDDRRGRNHGTLVKTLNLPQQ